MRDRGGDEAGAGARERRGRRLGAERRRRGGAAGAPLISDAGADDAVGLRALFGEYFAWLGREGWFPGGFDHELAALPGGYEALLLARIEESAVGCVALKRLSDEACEMKRLYVRPGARGSGTGRALVEASIARARELGYAAMRLDTLPAMDAARALYLSLGFRPIDRYNDNPIEGVLFFELTLAR
ncbi:MAG TPA: GNAT family N-acetyltransferase [Gaiellaceae bacterium]|nr:GNAT family N-acetyltransferase [Gaiellaceae bacterium]